MRRKNNAAHLFSKYRTTIYLKFSTQLVELLHVRGI